MSSNLIGATITRAHMAMIEAQIRAVAFLAVSSALPPSFSTTRYVGCHVTRSCSCSCSALAFRAPCCLR